MCLFIFMLHATRFGLQETHQMKSAQQILCKVNKLKMRKINLQSITCCGFGMAKSKFSNDESSNQLKSSNIYKRFVRVCCTQSKYEEHFNHNVCKGDGLKPWRWLGWNIIWLPFSSVFRKTYSNFMNFKWQVQLALYFVFEQRRLQCSLSISHSKNLFVYSTPSLLASYRFTAISKSLLFVRE